MVENEGDVKMAELILLSKAQIKMMCIISLAATTKYSMINTLAFCSVTDHGNAQVLTNKYTALLHLSSIPSVPHTNKYFKDFRNENGDYTM